ncbi:MAG: hypothetical protein MJ252_23350 [archaeon]|nr:hypothetical protein [archaeon]
MEKGEKKPKDFYLERAPEPTKPIDIFQHIKMGIKSAENCKCKNTIQYYCIPCKISICSTCGLNDHQKHSIVQKNQFELSDDRVSNILSPLKETIKNCSLIEKTEDKKKAFLKEVDDTFTEIDIALKDYKKRIQNEIEFLFSNLEKQKQNILKTVEDIKGNTKQFVDKNRKFFNIPDENGLDQLDLEAAPYKFNDDSNNMIFLMNYDIINLLEDKSRKIVDNLEKLVDIFEEYKSDEIRDLKKNKGDIMKIIETGARAFGPAKAPKSKRSEKNLTPLGIKPKPKRSEKIMDTFTAPELPKKKKSDNNLIGLLASKNLNETLNSKSSKKSKENVPMKPMVKDFVDACEEMNTPYFQPINERFEKYNDHINNFKRAIFKKVKEEGGLKSLEKSIALFEKNKPQGADSLFAERKQTQTIQSKSATKTLSKYSKTLTHKYKENDDVALNNPSVMKYFSYLTLEFYNKNFRIVSKELKSSHADLKIDVGDDKEAEEQSYGKAIEGKNEIVIYDKKKNTMTKYKVKLTKNPYGYTKFPIGCRCLLIGNKLYITGGKDEYKEYGNVLIYDIETGYTKRIMDLCEPRSYHSLIYNEVFGTIMVIGGENKRSMEIFDPLTNRWQMLPLMNVPRSNPLFYFDKPRGIMYTMFGVEGEFKKGKYTDIIEFFDLEDKEKGWNILDYENKSQADLKNMVQIYPLNSDVLLIYGGVSFRGNTRALVLMDIPKMEVINIDNKTLEMLKIESRRNKVLSKILSGSSTSTFFKNKA